MGLQESTRLLLGKYPKWCKVKVVLVIAMVMLMLLGSLVKLCDGPIKGLDQCASMGERETMSVYTMKGRL